MVGVLCACSGSKTQCGGTTTVVDGGQQPSPELRTLRDAQAEAQVEDDIQEAGTGCTPHVDVGWDEGLPDFHFVGFPCVSADQKRLAYALSNEGSSESVVLIDLVKGTIADRVDLVLRSELDDALEHEKSLSDKRIQARITRANGLFPGAWTYASYTHGSEELESSPIVLAGFAFRAYGGMLTVQQGTQQTYAVPLSRWYGKSPNMYRLSDVALLETWGFVARSVAEGSEPVLRVVPWTKP